MAFTVGEKVVYPGRGPCLVEGIVQKVVCGRSASFYRLALLDDTKADLFVPVDGFSHLQTRSLLDRSEIPMLLNRLKTHAAVPGGLETPKSWRQRAAETSKLFKSGSIFDLADMVGSLTQSQSNKPLAPHERATLQRARELLVCEIAEVLNESKVAAEERIDRALNGPGESEPDRKLNAVSLSVGSPHRPARRKRRR
ncbi:MAG TPA: CarD family transcriptional regulator [candidate division Zixibacteria bacterium]|nr:CarD family transcriptional regulator [candidate division Zixibacteria bacterium]